MENDLFFRIQNNDEKAFEQMFKLHYTPLCRYAYTIVQNKDACEEIVQEVFLKIWLTRNKIELRSTIASYLLRAVKNQSLNFLNKKSRSLEISIEHFSHDEKMYHDPFEEEDTEIVDKDDLKQKLIMAVESLPEQCRKIFELSRFEKKKYKEIAQELNISVKTVEAQMGIAFKKLRAFVQFIILFIKIF